MKQARRATAPTIRPITGIVTTMSIATVLGVLLGWLAAVIPLLATGLCLVPWAIAGLALGVGSASGRRATASGACFGFALAFTFMVAAYDGSDPCRDVLVLFVLLGLFGAVCGAVLAVVGSVGRHRLRRRSEESVQSAGEG